jgi:hypothetical protein
MGRLRCALATLVAGVLLVACSDDDPEPKVSDPTPSAANTSAMVSTSPPGSPITAKSPEDAVSAWVGERNNALATGQTDRLRSLTDLTCSSCLSLITSIEEVYAAGGRYDTEGWTIKSAKARGGGDARRVVDAAVVIAGGTTIDHAGAEPVTYGPQNHIMVFKLHEVDGSLLVDFVGFVS